MFNASCSSRKINNINKPQNPIFLLWYYAFYQKFRNNKHCHFNHMLMHTAVHSEGGGKASRTRISSIPQFTHKHRVAAMRSPVALPSRTSISSCKISCDVLLKYKILYMPADFDLFWKCFWRKRGYTIFTRNNSFACNSV